MHPARTHPHHLLNPPSFSVSGQSVLSRVVNWMIETKPIYGIMKLGAMNAMKSTTQKAGIDWDGHVRRMAATPEVGVQQQQQWQQPQQQHETRTLLQQYSVTSVTSGLGEQLGWGAWPHSKQRHICWQAWRNTAQHPHTDKAVLPHPPANRQAADQTPAAGAAGVWTPSSCLPACHFGRSSSSCSRSLSSSRTPTWPTLTTTQCPSMPTTRATSTGRWVASLILIASLIRQPSACSSWVAGLNLSTVSPNPPAAGRPSRTRNICVHVPAPNASSCLSTGHV